VDTDELPVVVAVGVVVLPHPLILTPRGGVMSLVWVLIVVLLVVALVGVVR
jgi:hypothetical protein